jgi:hypothetical protein
VARKPRARWARVVQSEGVPTLPVLQSLIRPPDGMTAVDLPDGRRVLAPTGADPEAVRRQVDCEETRR